MDIEHAATAADIKAIEEVVATVERTQRAKDAEGFLALFHPDALWTTGHGKVLIGFEEIAENVMTREADGPWLLTACQNTQVVHDPA
ncbi:SgcJ/EcaC family oxidoreductase [Streptomyces yangpuensis]|uniref:SgcJ/EcaC family oxidoreductase n=1 Tax=Streptomyces yangpuensis TaxID=1648182 RepID=UPI003719F814